MKLMYSILELFKNNKRNSTIRTVEVPLPDPASASVVDAYVSEKVAEFISNLPENKWDKLSVDFPQTYQVMQKIKTARPDLVAGVTDLPPGHNSNLGREREFTLAFPGLETAEQRSAKSNHDQQIIYPHPLIVRIRLDNNTIVYAGRRASGGGIIDAHAAKAVLDTALSDGLITQSAQEFGLNGKPLIEIVAGPVRRPVSRPILTLVT